MTLDELAVSIEKASRDKEVRALAELIKSWKADESTVSELSSLVERYIGQVWFKTDAIHQKIYSAWQSFKADAILNIGGMTMNERLYTFGLFGRFDAGSEHEQSIVYAKLQAQR